MTNEIFRSNGSSLPLKGIATVPEIVPFSLDGLRKPKPLTEKVPKQSLEKAISKWLEKEGQQQSNNMLPSIPGSKAQPHDVDPGFSWGKWNKLPQHDVDPGFSWGKWNKLPQHDVDPGFSRAPWAKPQHQPGGSDFPKWNSEEVWPKDVLPGKAMPDPVTGKYPKTIPIPNATVDPRTGKYPKSDMPANAPSAPLDKLAPLMTETLENESHGRVGPSYKPDSRTRLTLDFVVDDPKVPKMEHGVYHVKFDESGKPGLFRDAGRWDGQFYTPRMDKVDNPSTELLQSVKENLEQINTNAKKEIKQWSSPR